MNKPKVRFKNFNEDWEQRKLGDICKSFEYGLNAASKEFDGKNKYIRITDIDDVTHEFIQEGVTSPDIDLENMDTFRLKCGDILFARTGASVGKTYIYKESDGLVYYAGFLICGHIKENYNPDFIFQNTLTESYNRFIRVTSQRSGQPGVNAQEYENFSICTPSLEEQKKIGGYFRTLDSLITLHQRKCDEVKIFKKYMLQNMFPKNGESFPKIRFKGFTDAWEQRKLGNIMNITSVKRIHQSDWTTDGVRFLRARDIVSASKNEESEDCLYISKEKYEEYSLISGKVVVDDLLVTGVGTIGVPYLIRNSEPIYFKDGNIIWFQNNKKIDGGFLYYSFIGDTIQSFIYGVAGTGTVGTYTIENGKKTPILLPSRLEQEKIGSYFQTLDNLITLHQQKCEELQNFKKFMLQTMFV